MEPLESKLPPGGLQDTALLLQGVKDGDATAKNTLFLKYYPHLMMFMHNRLSFPGRRLRETQDLVQEVFVRALPKLSRFENHGIGALWAFLRQIAINHIHELWRQQYQRKNFIASNADTVLASNDPSPLELLVKKEKSDAFDQAVARLDQREKEALLLRMELGLTYKAIADDLDFPSEDSVRMAIRRASIKIHEELYRGRVSS